MDHPPDAVRTAVREVLHRLKASGARWSATPARYERLKIELTGVARNHGFESYASLVAAARSQFTQAGMRDWFDAKRLGWYA